MKRYARRVLRVHATDPATREQAWCGANSHQTVKLPVVVDCPKCIARMVKAGINPQGQSYEDKL